MTNLFLDQPSLFVQDTVVEAVRHDTEGRPCIAPAQNIFRAAGGGQPQDQGSVDLDAAQIQVGRIFKDGARTWISLSGDAAERLNVGMPVRLKVDGSYRNRLSRCHSLVHLLMSAIRNVMRGYESKGATISADATRMQLRFRADEALSDSLLAEIDVLARHLIAANRPIHVRKSRSIENAAACFRQWRVDPDLNLTGRIRVIDIEGIDQNPCSGSHVPSTGAIGAFEILSSRLDDRGVNLLAVAVAADWRRWYAERSLELCARVKLSAFDL
jgi:Ser-tRNA(Ala) deacylase AlaX